MRSRPASQLADDGEADGTPVPPAYDPSSEEPLPHKDGVRKSVGSPLTGAKPNVVAQRSPPAEVPAADQDHPAPPAHAGGLPAAFAPRQAAGGQLTIHLRRLESTLRVIWSLRFEIRTTTRVHGRMGDFYKEQDSVS